MARDRAADKYSGGSVANQSKAKTNFNKPKAAAKKKAAPKPRPKPAQKAKIGAGAKPKAKPAKPAARKAQDRSGDAVLGQGRSSSAAPKMNRQKGFGNRAKGPAEVTVRRKDAKGYRSKTAR